MHFDEFLALWKDYLLVTTKKMSSSKSIFPFSEMKDSESDISQQMSLKEVNFFDSISYKARTKVVEGKQ